MNVKLEMEEDKKEIIDEFHNLFKQATDRDLWGQPLEAVSCYRRLSCDLHDCIIEEQKLFNDEQKKILGKIKTCVDLRTAFLQRTDSAQCISLDDLNKIKEVFDLLLSMKSKDFPIDVSAAEIWAHTMNSIAQVQNETESNEENTLDEQNRIKARGSLLPKPLPIGGKQVLTILILKVGVKDSSQYLEPFITVSVKDNQGVDLTAAQHTPVSGMKEDQYVHFNIPVHIQKPVDILPPGYAIFFEFKHYKPRKKSTSTKCWSFMEKDEIKDGEVALELYKKPTDIRRKTLRLLTVKPLYLHLKLSLNT